MRIAVLTRAIPWHGGGGMERVSWDLMAAWADAGADVQCVTTPVPRAPTSYGSVTVATLPGRPGRYSGAWWDATADAVRRLKPDLVLGVSAGAHAVVRKGCRVPVVMQAHGTILDEMLTKLRVRSARSMAALPRDVRSLTRDVRRYPRYCAVVAVGPAVASSLARYPRPLAPRRVVVIENGVPDRRDDPGDPRQFLEQFQLPVGSSVALAVGRLHPEKGVRHAVAALVHWPGCLLVVGAGPDRCALEVLAARLGVDDRVRFLGWVDQATIARALAGVDCLVVPSRRREGLPTVVLEALAARLPVVVSSLLWSTLPADLQTQVVPSSLEPEALAASLAASVQRTKPSLPDTYRLATSASRYLDLFDSVIAEREVNA